MSAPRLCEFDMRYLPLVLVRAPEAIDEAGVRDLFDRFDQLYRSRTRYATVIDSTPTRELPSPKLRKMLGDLAKASADEARRWCVGTAMVVTSPVVRGLFTAVGWVAPNPTPTVHVATMKEAVLWCCDRLEAAKIELPTETERYRREMAGSKPA